MTTSTFTPPTTTWHSDGPATDRPVVVLLHGRGNDERGIIGLADVLPGGAEYVAVRAPIAEGDGFAWFDNRGIGRPIRESLDATRAWFDEWLDANVAPERPVVLVGFSGGAAFAGGLVLARPERYAGAAILNGTLPFDAGVPTDADRLHGVSVFVARGAADSVIPGELLERTWAYLHAESGARVTSRLDPGGHGLTQGTVDELAAWLDGVLTAATPSDGR